MDQKNQAIEAEISNPQESFFTHVSIKRMLQGQALCVSRRLISAKILNSSNRWVNNEPTLKKSKYEPVPTDTLEQAKSFVNNLLQGICNKNKLNFTDQIKLVVNQIPLKVWK